ncbi:MAG: hypothetical protein EXX96DRAFT_607641 [Benjaminiella poitrasii]|nr:MAG: hypothetical protein EXX96DRAFT_607641 [Benjaminiella poitrasii]
MKKSNKKRRITPRDSYADSDSRAPDNEKAIFTDFYSKKPIIDLDDHECEVNIDSKKASKAILNENNLKKRKFEDSVNKSIYDLNEEEDEDEYFNHNLKETDLVDNYTDMTSYHVDDDTLFEMIPTQLNAALSSQNILNIETSIDEDSNVSYKSYSRFLRTIVDNTIIVRDDDLEKDYEYLDHPDLCFQEPALYIRSETSLFTPNETILNSNIDGLCFIDATFEILWHCVLPWVADEIFDSKKINESTNAFDKVLLRSATSSSDSSATSSFGASSDSTTSVGMNSNEVMRLIESNLIPINNENTFKINDVNVLQRFHDFQNSLGTSPLTYKSHIHHILSTSGILLVKSHQHPDLLKFIDSKTTSMMLKNTYEQIGLHGQKFSRNTFVQLFESVQQYSPTAFRFKSLIEQLPNDSFEVKELELTTRLIQPLLQQLFEDRAENLYLHWTDTQTEEFKKDEINCSNKRPDGCASISFYLTEQQCKGFYTMTEIDHLNTPKNLAELLQLFEFVDNLCNLLHVFKTSCRQQ